MSSLSKQVGIAFIVVSGLAISNVRGVEAPYADNFDSYPSGGQPAHFIPSVGDSWGISNPTGTSGRYGSGISSTPVPAYAHSVMSLENVPGRDFTVSTRFSATVQGGGPILDASVGLIALSSSDPSVFPTQCYTLEYFVASGLDREGTLAVRGGSASWETDDFFRLFDVGQGFTMSLQGEYVDGTLFLTATLSNGIGTITYHGTDAAPPSGPYFGYWDRVSGTALRYAQLYASYDDFEVTVAGPSPSPSPSPSVSPSPSASPSPSPSPSPSASPSPPEPARFVNISTRLKVGSGDNAAIGGFIISGVSPRQILVRGVKPHVSGGLPGALEDPTLELHGSDGVVLATNDNWRDSQQAEIEQTGLPPSNNLDSAIVTTVAPGSHTAVLRGKADTTGIGLVEVYDFTQGGESKLENFGTRGAVGVGDNVMIGGVIVLGETPATVLVRALGPSLQSFGLDSLADPMLALHDGNGALLASNDNWRENQQVEIEATGLAPTNVAESAILADFLPANYTAIVRGKNNTTGIALVELYHLN